VSTWVNQEGTVCITNRPGAVWDLKKDGGKGSKASSKKSPAAPPQTRPPDARGTRYAFEGRNPESIELFVTSWCPSCKRARNYFIANRISFTEYDIGRNAEALFRFQKLSPEGLVPLTVIGGFRIIGFHPEAFQKALK